MNEKCLHLGSTFIDGEKRIWYSFLKNEKTWYIHKIDSKYFNIANEDMLLCETNFPSYTLEDVFYDTKFYIQLKNWLQNKNNIEGKKIYTEKLPQEQKFFIEYCYD